MNVNYETGEIATVDTTSEVAVTSYLQQARDWLATAVESTGPEQIARAKAEIATAAEATKQLGLSKDIQGDASEMVRRAEYALRKAVTKAQESGEANRPHREVSPAGDSSKPSPASYFGSRKEYQDANAMGALDADEFDQVLADAKAEGNTSRANVAAKSKARRQIARPRPAAEVLLNTISSHADRAARETHKLTADQIRRVKPNAAEWIGGIRESIEVLENLVRSLEEN